MADQQPLTKIAEGREAEMFAWKDGHILRLLRDAERVYQAEWEARALKAARNAGVRAPAPLEIVNVMGRPGLVMERVPGPDLLAAVSQRPWQVLAAGRTCGKAHSGIHAATAPPELPRLRDQLANRLRSSLVPDSLRKAADVRLELLPDGDRLCHGDFHPGNVLLDSGESVVIDWTNASAGEPAGDVARALLLLRLAEPPPGSAFLLRTLARAGGRVFSYAYLSSYRKHAAMGDDAIDAWMLPVSVARLAENVSEERTRLLRFIEELRGRPA